MGVYYNIRNDLEIRERKSQLLVEFIWKSLNPIDWRRKWQPTPVFLPGESQGWGSLLGCHLWGRTELDTTEVTQQQQQLIAQGHWVNRRYVQELFQD